MADPFSISLRAWPAQDTSNETLPSLIARINEQRGSFRNISESKLKEEAQTVDIGEVSLEDQTNALPGVDSQDVKTRREEVSTAREEILKQVAWVYVHHSVFAMELIEAQSSLLRKRSCPRLCVAFAHNKDSPPSRTHHVSLPQAEPTVRLLGYRRGSGP